MDTRDLSRTVKSFFNFRAGRTSYEGIYKRVLSGSRINGIHMCQLIAAMIIASIGLNVNSTEAIVGAMLICPLMGSVIAIAYAIATVNMKLFKQSVTGLVSQFLVCLITSTVYFLISPLGSRTAALLSNSTPTIWDVLIALVGGFAGALGMSRQQEPATLLSGVAVATSLMPPLCASGYGFAVRDLVLASSAMYEFCINVVFIAFGAEMVFVLLKVPPLRDVNGDGVVTPQEELEVQELSHELRRRLVIGSIVFALPCLFFTSQMVKAQIEETGTVFEVIDSYDTEMITRELDLLVPEMVSYHIGIEDSYDQKKGVLVQEVVATVMTDEELDQGRQHRIEQLLRLHVHDLDRVVFSVETAEEVTS